MGTYYLSESWSKKLIQPFQQTQSLICESNFRETCTVKLHGVQNATHCGRVREKKGRFYGFSDICRFFFFFKGDLFFQIGRAGIL